MKLAIKKMYDDVTLPEYATAGAACFDIRVHDKTLPPFGVALSNGDACTFSTGLKFEIPQGHVMLVYSRSGHGFRNDVRLSNCTGVIDSDYRGELMVKLHADFNNGAETLVVKHGDRVAQAMLVKLPKVEIVEVVEVSETERGEGGFGSTGVK